MTNHEKLSALRCQLITLGACLIEVMNAPGFQRDFIHEQALAEALRVVRAVRDTIEAMMAEDVLFRGAVGDVKAGALFARD